MTEKALQKVSGALVVSAISTLVLFLVLVTTYAVYLFMKATKLPEVAGIHLSKNISLQVKSMEGELYSNSEKGIENWVISDPENAGFQIKYPNDWEKQKTENGILLKTYNKQVGSMQSLAMSILAERKRNSGAKELQEMLNQKGIKDWKTAWSDELSKEDGKVRTELLKGSDGLLHEFVFWKAGNDVVLLEGVFYNEKNAQLQKNFEDVVSEFKIN